MKTNTEICSPFEGAKWITLGSLPDMMPDNYGILNGSIYFREEFTIRSGLQAAKLFICALGLGVCTINGKPVTDEVLTTPYTQYDKRVLYQTYDVTQLLHTGANAIGVHVGNGFYNDNMSLWEDLMADWKDNPKLIAALSVTYQSGEQVTFLSGPSWRSTGGPAVYNHMRQGEVFDARLRQDGYDTVGFDDSGWEQAALAYEPGGVLDSIDAPPIRVIRVLKPVKCQNGIYDFGENISGWVKIKLCGQEGQEVHLTYDENLNQDGGLLRECSCFARREGKPGNEDRFICSGKEEEYRPSFCYHGFRYVQVENAPDTFEITAEVVHTDLEQVGNFVCDDDMLNKIHEASVRATLSNFMGMPTDCPHREQLGWTGDAQLSSQQVLMNFEVRAAYGRWLKCFKEAQRPSGQLPGIIPSPGWGYNWGNGPTFDSALIIIPYNVYIATGDTTMIREMWENMVRLMGYMERLSVDGVLDIGLGDWKPVRQPSCPSAVLDTAYVYADCVMMAEMAELLGRDAEIWKEKAATVRQVWRDKFLGDPELEQFQTFWSCAIYQGLLDEEEIPAAASRLAALVEENDYHIDCGFLGAKYMFSALAENGYMDVLYRMVTNPTFPSYAWWILQGQTTLCECWDMSESCNHHMFSEVDHWLYRYVGGIKFTRQGLVIQPQPLENVDYVKVEHRGICVEREGHSVKVVLPCEAEVIIGETHQTVPAGEHRFNFDEAN